MPTTGNILTERFNNHSKTTQPSNTILNTHYRNLDKNQIESQTGSADWFLAVLHDAPTFGGIEGHLYVIYNPTDQNGNAVTSDVAVNAKLCAAPNPPFNQGEQASGLVVRIERIERMLEEIIERQGNAQK